MNRNKLNSYLSFKLGSDTYAANVLNTLKILQFTDITRVPNSPNQLVGVINHHGNVLPVIDLKQALNLSKTEVGDNTCIIVLALDNDGDASNIGAIVDEVLNVEEVEPNDISEAPSLGKANTLEHIEGVFKKDDEFIMILNIERILSDVSQSINN